MASTLDRTALTEILGGLSAALATVTAWWFWLGWDTKYDVDPITQAVSGPYTAWQVAGCVVSLIVIAAVGGWLLRPWLAAITIAVTFTLAWSWRAATTDGSGVWLVGAVLIAAAMALGATAVSFGAHVLGRRRRPN